MKKIVVIDDSLYMRTIIKDALTSANFEVVGEAGTGEDAIDLILDLNPDLVTLDNILPDMLGLDIIKTLKDEHCPTKILMVSAVGQQSVINTGLSLGADGYVVKPFTPEQLIDSIHKVLG